MMDLADAVNLLESQPLRPPAWLRSPHRQTVAGTVTLHRAEEGHFFSVQSEPGTRIVYLADATLAPGASVLLIVHGKGGSARSALARSLAGHARRRGLCAVRMNMRGCGRGEGLSPTLYHGNLPQDVAAVVGDLIERHRIGRLFLVGYSVGGSLVLNTLAHWADRPPAALAGTLAICPPIDVELCVSRLDGRPGSLYRRHVVRAMRRFYVRQAARFPERFDARRVHSVRLMRDFDRVATAPDGGFSEVGDLYGYLSASSRLDRIAAPAIIVQAEDDPIVALTSETRRRIRGHRSLALVETPLGGHCGYVELPSRHLPDGRWIADRAARIAEQALA